MKDSEMIRTGKQAGREPAGTPYARGMFLMVKRNPKHPDITDEEMKQMNLLAQKVLASQSELFAKAQKHWTELPHTPARQMENSLYEGDRLDPDGKTEQEWISLYAEKPGLVYIFRIELEIDVRTGEERKPFPVVGFSPMRGFDFMDDLIDEDCIKYRLCFAYAEKEEKEETK